MVHENTPTELPPFDPYDSGKKVYGDVRAVLAQNTDAFDELITRQTRNSIDIPAYHDFSQERQRLRLNGSQTTPSDISAQFTDTDAAYALQPDSGNRIRFHTAERPRYIVGYEAAASTAVMMRQELGTGDQVNLGLTDNRDPETGAYFEINPDSANRAVLKDNGTEVATEEWSYPDGLDETTPVRFEIKFNWYNVGRYLFTLSYTDGSRLISERQRLDDVAELVVDDDFATSVGAYYIFTELDAANSGKELETGSLAFIVLGDVDETSRVKADRTVLTGAYGGSGDYEPIYALRLDQSRRGTYVELDKVTVFPAQTSGELIVIGVDPGDTDASGWGTPNAQTTKNSVIEVTDSVSTFPDESGSVVSTSTDPGGYQLQQASFEAAGTGSNSRSSIQPGVITKRPIYDDDVAVFLYKADSATSDDVTLTHITEQTW